MFNPKDYPRERICHDDLGENVYFALSYNSEKHDALCSIDESFYNTKKAINQLIKKDKSCVIHVPFVEQNTDDFEKIVPLFYLLGVRHFHLTFSHEGLLKKALPGVKKVIQKYSDLKLTTQKQYEVVVGIVLGRPVSPPRRAVIEIANDCNLRCDFCWSHSPLNKEELANDGAWKKKKLDKHMMFKYIDELKESNVRLVELCAIGEPLFHPDIWEIIDYIKGKSLSLRLSTNGTLITKDKIDRFLEIGVEEIFMNISSGDRDTYSDIHNVSPKMYDQLVDNLSYLGKIKKDKPIVRIINVITCKNIDSVEKMLAFGQQINADYMDFRRVWIHNEHLRELKEDKDMVLRFFENYESYQRILNDVKFDNNLGEYAQQLRETYL